MTGTSSVSPDTAAAALASPNAGSLDEVVRDFRSGRLWTADPRLFCPGPGRDAPDLGSEVDNRLLNWAERMGFVPGLLDRLRVGDFGRLLMLVHPTSDDPDRLLAAAKCLVTLWIMDDYCDDASLGADPHTIGTRHAHLYAMVDPTHLPTGYACGLERFVEGSLAAALRSAVAHLLRYASSAQLGRFQHQVALQSTSLNHEADWRRHRRTPPVREYLLHRHQNGFLPSMILIDVVAGYELGADEFYRPPFRRALTVAGHAGALLNDLYSAADEDGTDFNLITLIAAERNCSRGEAVRRTIGLHNELMHSFVAQVADLHRGASPTMRRFLDDAWAWLGGSRVWHATSGRYRGNHPRPHPPSTAGSYP